ncbi:MAG: YggS family pyridoxal phosphate-dependent enzyme [Alphaproteobacteria bacterium]|nr:YggS family pyridoxal phosphate-dependent enzyme [Alphaproteobacteria bacterium]MDE2336939.1 YggS family pyridoxal phosphate-dependent enzyme [Alphaproteobacteria bacterium]
MSLADVRADIVSACKTAGRKEDSVMLVAVSKFQPADRVETLLKAGQRVFGENRVQEAEEKYPALREKYPDLQLHFIGHLQTNKARAAVALFDVIETVDRAELAQALRKEMDKQGRDLPCFIQVNTGEEPQKGGVAPHDLPALYQTCKDLKLKIAGLMCIPPAEDIPDLHFALLAKLAAELGLKQLSMGMSADFQTAIKYGATHVRVGTALFGTRQEAA